MAGFMAGFGTTFSNLVEEDRKYYREAAAKRRDYLQTYGTRAILDREEKANAAMGTVNYLISNGLEEDDVRYVLDTSGVQGIAQLKATLDSRDDLTADEKKALVKKAKDYVTENPDMDMNSVVRRAYGLYKGTDNPVKRERNLFSAVLGLDSRMMDDAVMDDLYVNGYTGRDIYRIMGSAGPSVGAPLDLNLPAKRPSPTIINNTTNFLQAQFEASIDARLKDLRDSMIVDGKASPDYEELKRKEQKLLSLKAKNLLAIGEYATEYDPALFRFAKAQEEMHPGSILRNSNLQEFVPAFKAFFEEPVDEAKIDKGMAKSKDTGEDEGDGKDAGKDATDYNVVTEIEVDDAKIKVVKTEEGLQLVDTDGSLLSVEESEKIVNATQKFKYEHLVMSYPDEEKPRTPEDMNNSLAEPFKDGDPRPEEGLFNSYAKEYRIKVWDAMYGDTRNPDGTLKSSKGDSKSKEPVTTDVKLMQEYGSSILQHMDDAGLTVGSTDEEIQEELAAWFSDNSTDPNVPALVGVDNDIVIRTIRKFLSEGS